MMKVINKTGKKWSTVSVEVESNFNAWLVQAEIKKEDLLTRINKNSFKMKYSNERDEIRILLSDDIGTIGIPFVWIKNGKIPLAYFKADAALILLYISSLCINDKSKKEIKNFIKIYKLDK